jgi:pyruvate formate lyase activating enzyme
MDLKIAKWWELLPNGKILCTLCPRYCTIGNGQKGFCYIRENIDNILYSTGYGRPTGFAVDPIEKKPLSHFLPGTNILSFGTAGCNLGCKFCQNWTMSKSKTDDINSLEASPEQVINLAKKYRTPSIAYTYNDPTIFGEYVIDISKIAKEENIKNIMVTAGYIDNKARKDVYRYIDAANVDLKSFTERFYHNLTYSHLSHILDTLIWLKNETDIWIEITTLLIPDENDSPDEIKQLANWIVENLDENVPLHFTAFHPDFKMKDKSRTPSSTLTMARNIAFKEGLNYCYVGNVHSIEGQTTYCPKCNNPVIIRDWHSVLDVRLKNGHCQYCKEKISGVFN